MASNYIVLTSQTDNQKYDFTTFRNVSIEYDLDDVSSTMSFEISSFSTIASVIKKYDYFEYYVMPPNGNSYVCKFRGYVDKLLKSRSKTARKITVQCLDKLSRFNRVNMERSLSVDNLKYLIEAIVAQADAVLPGFLRFDLRLDGSEIIIRNLEPSTNILEYLRNIREKAVLYVYYDATLDKVVITTPLYLQYKYRTSGFDVYEFDSKTNMLDNIDYGDVSNDINAVIYYGMGGVKGMAIDFANYSSNSQIRPLYRYDFSTDSKEELEKKARNELLDILRNYSMNFSIALNPQSLAIAVGSMCTIEDHDTYHGDRFFIISKINFSFAKGNMILNLTVRAGTITDVPEDMVLQDYGITDIDTLEINDKENGELT